VNWGFEPQRGEPVNARKLCLRAGNPTSKTLKSKNRQKAVFAEYGRDGRVNWGFEPQRGKPVNARKLCLRAGNPTSKTLKSKNRQKAVFVNMVGTAG
jgi:hypothetical protein